MGSRRDVGYKAVAMTDEDRRTTPAAADAADSEHDDVYIRDTIPVPQAPERRSPQVVASAEAGPGSSGVRRDAGRRGPDDDGVETLRDGEVRALDDDGLETLPDSEVTALGEDKLETLRDSEVTALDEDTKRRDSDAETWRPPPPDRALPTVIVASDARVPTVPEPPASADANAASRFTAGASDRADGSRPTASAAEDASGSRTTPGASGQADGSRPTASAADQAGASRPATSAVEYVGVSRPATSAVDQSSIAPREMAKRRAEPQRGGRRALGLFAAAILFGIGAIVLQRADRDTRSTGAAAAGAARETAAATPSLAGESADSTSSQAAGAEPEAAPAPALATTREPASTAKPGAARRRAPRARDAKALPSGDLPETPSREAIAAALQPLRGAIELCSAGHNGVAELDLTIRGSGALAHALIGGDFGGTPQGSCIARTLRRAQFAPFQRPKFRVLYKLAL